MKNQASIFSFQLLFQEKPDFNIQAIHHKMGECIGQVDLVQEENLGYTFAARDYIAPYADQESPAFLLLFKPKAFSNTLNLEMIQQMWDLEGEAENILNDMHFSVHNGDLLGVDLPLHERGQLLMDYLQALLVAFPECRVVYIDSAQNLVDADRIRHYQGPAESRLPKLAINTRIWKIDQGDSTYLVDTLGLHVFGLPDLQYYVQGIGVSDIVAHASLMAQYIYSENNPIQDQETTAGYQDGQFRRDMSWTMSYTESFAEPKRIVLDFDTGEYNGRQV